MRSVLTGIRDYSNTPRRLRARAASPCTQITPQQSEIYPVSPRAALGAAFLASEQVQWSKLKQIGVNTMAKSAEPRKKHQPPCPIMHECGGCETLNRPYKKQLAAKQAAMGELFAPLCKRAGITVDPIRGMGATYGDEGKYPSPRAFRYKAATPFAPGPRGKVRCGFYQRGTHDIIPLANCAIEAPGARDILNRIARIAELLDISAYNEDTHRGILRYAIVRAGWRTNEIMVTVVTSRGKFNHSEEFFRGIANISPNIVCVAQNMNGKVTNAILGPDTVVVSGRNCLHDKLLGCDFDISPTAFYQTNPEQTELLYQIAIEGMNLHAGDVLLDAYCGSGTIGICAAKAADKAGRPITLFGVERNPAGIADANRNAQLNGLGASAWFVEDDATEYMLDAAENHERVDVLSIDPPRAGSTPDFLEAAIKLGPRRIVYISCNPKTQARDLVPLMDAGYRLLSITPVDMFPHTSHVETVAVLARG